ncbi:hypothetical protein KC19_1G099300 [Ceratodon purpureus]|uniref:Uncharacterized protein n=1 Tax=Ceratodon purpureus TaxID=3225 RepID=A0A8T0J6J1_CERPU|nr:hypothetical protein KC19_1G099300 [Ceratodon purpureus]
MWLAHAVGPRTCVFSYSLGTCHCQDGSIPATSMVSLKFLSIAVACTGRTTLTSSTLSPLNVLELDAVDELALCAWTIVCCGVA